MTAPRHSGGRDGGELRAREGPASSKGGACTGAHNGFESRGAGAGGVAGACDGPREQPGPLQGAAGLAGSAA
jgi:hypothetical protein